MENKTGRPRLYEFKPAPGMKNNDAGLYLAAMNELMERVIDQVVHLPVKALDFTPAETAVSIGWLLKHLAWADIRMFGIAMGQSTDQEMKKRLDGGSAAGLEGGPIHHGDSDTLIELMRQVRTGYVIPWCSEIQDIRQPVKEKGPLSTVEKVFMQMCYHWSYHSGQIGLLSLQAGFDYTWTFPSV